MTTIYFMRHSEALKPINIENNDSLQLQNEKWILTSNGENIAKKISETEELKDFDMVFSSNYVRAICTAKYFTNNKIHIVESFGERKFGINSWDEMPVDFEKKQWADFDYQVGNGESLNKVKERELNALAEILTKHKNKKILIVGHSTALATLFSNWCDIDYSGYKYNGEIFFNGKWNYCETFKLVFDDENNLKSIKNLKF